MHMSAELKKAGYKFLERFHDPTRVPKNLLDSVGLPANYQSMSLYMFIIWLHSTLPAKNALKAVSSRMH